MDVWNWTRGLCTHRVAGGAAVFTQADAAVQVKVLGGEEQHGVSSFLRAGADQLHVAKIHRTPAGESQSQGFNPMTVTAENLR